ncbi:diacylglycerol/lipid kinase family protein [Nakamurella deserti]|uniref:diacylglycerol/lipid kinase family protein n=1 Tax=Nakamurella deserti TaxID=2164074 RepID=UPI000DBE3393|nr:diacylglycerol kinase family protein [Nakamurella deserti]
MRALLIVNPHATATTARRRDLLAHALASQMKLRIAHTTGRGHAAELAARAAADGFGLVVVHAGDGTVNETVNGLMQNPPGSRRPVLAVVPGGSTNVFARALGLAPDPTDATEQILEALSQRRVRTVSLGRADDRYFTFNAGLGLDAEVVAEVEKQRADGSTISNAMHVRELLKLYVRGDRGAGPLRLEIPGRPPIDGGVLTFVSNVDPWTFVGSRPVRTNPGTSLDGGLGVFALRSLSLPTVLRVGTALLRRDGDPRGRQLIRHDDIPALTVRSARPIGFQVDGDYLGKRTEVAFSSVPDALRVLV